MSALSIPALRCGGPAYLPQSHVLRAGPLSMLLEEGEIRRVKLGEREVIRRIYVTLRGPEWVTIPLQIAQVDVDQQENSFRVDIIAMHMKGEYDYMWGITINGTAEGLLRFNARGVARTGFSFNRVGICVLHPLAECAGQPAITTSPEGLLREGLFFPEAINPHQPFKDFAELTCKVGTGWLATMRWEGEVFEMEDQRNWSDGSFKTYCPPQERPKPFRMEAGTQRAQNFILALLNPEKAPPPDRPAQGASQEGRAVDPALPLLVPDLERGGAVPGFGFGLPSHGHMPDETDLARLRALHPTHVRADFRLGQAGFREELMKAATQALALDLPLEAALVVPPDGESLLQDVARHFADSGVEALRWLIFDEKADATSEETLEAARRILGPLDPLASFVRGSKGDFVLLNRNRPRQIPGQSLAYAVSPQVHLTDNRTLVEALEGQAWTVRTTHATWQRCKPTVTPITLKRSPFSIALKKPPAGEGSPVEALWRNQVDTRQFSLLGAGWTLGSLKRMALEGADSATYYETTGLLGLMSGNSLPPEFLKSPAFDFAIGNGWVYPMYHVFADFAEFVGGQAYDVKSDQPTRFDAVLLHAEERATLLIANLEERPGRVRLEELGNVGGIRRLNETNAMRAMREPEAWRKEPLAPCPGDADGWNLDFLPFEIVRLDLIP